MAVFDDIKDGLEQAIEYEEIDNLLDAAYWLYEAWAYEPYNIHYVKEGGLEYIDIEPIKDRDDLNGWTIDSLDEFKRIVERY